ncbi:Modulator of FtsH protease YccA [Candidatus Westeberhardia cardiocondylae]|uniref:Modulator of FtsH protease YccA n=1 Tax=Candidatus Westeberhardia cardiocondylae TaxID=1594731 RepID=A0A0H5BWV9_9ENTR|nr:Bax inhibitor-1 family protein [Candidatus Westeberhardia cardiocondylae]MCR3756454.1 modulator of FtsH protease [Candidatus Westeberhardia cardiocondylae]CEN32173.1 Modulator of FtsH protease YccA [Candidatus Westeberhardia cardiocondylae]
MNRFIVTSSSGQSLLNTHKVLRNTYFLLSLTLAFSALIATISVLYQLPSPGIIVMLSGFYGLLFLVHKLANSSAGIVATFALTGFMGYTLGPLLNMLLSIGSGNVITLALGGTASVFLSCSIYVLTTKKDMSFLSGMMMAGFIVILGAIISNIFLQISALSLTISVMFILFSSAAILWETSNIIYGGENNYIRATVSLYVSLYNIFVSFISIFRKQT